MRKLNKKAEEKYMGSLRPKKRHKGCPKSKTVEKKHEFVLTQHHTRYSAVLSAYYLKWYFEFRCRLCNKKEDVKRLTGELSSRGLNRWFIKSEWTKQDLKVFDQCVKLPTNLNSPVDE